MMAPARQRSGALAERCPVIACSPGARPGPTASPSSPPAPRQGQTAAWTPLWPGFFLPWPPLCALAGSSGLCRSGHGALQHCRLRPSKLEASVIALARYITGPAAKGLPPPRSIYSILPAPPRTPIIYLPRTPIPPFSSTYTRRPLPSYTSFSSSSRLLALSFPLPLGQSFRFFKLSTLILHDDFDNSRRHQKHVPLRRLHACY